MSNPFTDIILIPKEIITGGKQLNNLDIF